MSYIIKGRVELPIEYMQWDGGSFDCALKASAFLSGQTKTEVLVYNHDYFMIRKSDKTSKYVLTLKTMRGPVPVQKDNFIVKIQPGVFVCMGSRDFYNSLVPEVH